MKRTIDEIVRSRFLNGVVKSSKIKARDFRVLSRSYGTPQGQRHEAQRKYWAFYDVVTIFLPIIIAVWLGFSGLTGCARMGMLPSPQKSLLEEYQQKALALESSDELQQALLAWSVAAALDPESSLLPKIIGNLTETIEKRAQQHFADGQAYYDNAEYDRAHASFLRVLRLSPGHPEAMHYLKERFHRIGREEYTVQKGDSFSRIALNIYQNADKAYMLAYFNNLDLDKPLLTGTRLVLPDLPKTGSQPKEKSGNQPLKKGTHKSLLPDRPVTAETGVPLTDAEIYRRGLDLMKEKRYTAALAALQEVSPDFSGRKKAIDQVHRLIRAEQIDITLEKAQMHFNRNEFEAACTTLETLVGQEPGHSGAMQLFNQSRSSWARELIIQEQEIKAIEILQTMEQSYQDTRELLVQAKARLNARAESHYRRGVKYFLNENLEKAIQAWKKALDLNPNHPKAAGDMENAMRLLEKWQEVSASPPDNSRSSSLSR